MYSAKFRFIISSLIISLLSVAFYENLTGVVEIFIANETGAYIMLSLYLLTFISGFIFIAKGFFSYVLLEEIKPILFVGFCLLSANFGYLEYDFNSFPIIDLSIELALFNKYLIGIHFIPLALIIFFRQISQKSTN